MTPAETLAQIHEEMTWPIWHFGDRERAKDVWLCETFREGDWPDDCGLHAPIVRCSKCEIAATSIALATPDEPVTLFGKLHQPVRGYLDAIAIMRWSDEYNAGLPRG